MVKLTINGIPLEVQENITILEAARKINIEIPTLCKHDDLPPTAACGICIVKIKNQNRIVRACSTPVTEDMDIITHDPELVQVRYSVLEMILSNHPNECLTCGRNGTCELQKLAEKFGIRRIEIPSIVRDIPADYSTKTIVLEPRKCIKCGRCVVVCQEKQNVWALCFLERGIDTRIATAGEIPLADSPCVRCGQCSAHCPVGAIYEYGEENKVWEALRNPDNFCIAQVAPAVRVSIGEAFGYPPGTNMSGQIYAALRRMGFKAVFDTNFGADMTVMEEASELVERIQHHPEKLPLISTCCPAWVDFMEKYHGDMIDHFSSCKSPHAILGVLTKTYYAQIMNIDPKRIFLVSIMPCTAKKYEISRSHSMFASGYQDIDISLTVREFVRMIKQAGIVFNDLPCLEEADSPLGQYSGAGVIFGSTGGVMEAALRTAHYLITGRDIEIMDMNSLRTLQGVKESTVTIGGRTLNVAVAHGLANVETVLNKVRDAKEKGLPSPYDFIEVMACPGGCVGGGGLGWGINDEIRKLRAEGLAKDDQLRPIRMSHHNPDVQRIYSEFLEKPLSTKSKQLLHTEYIRRPPYQR